MYIRGLHLEGAGWDKRNACLIEAEPMQLVCPIPTIHFKPVENKKKTGKGKYHQDIFGIITQSVKALLRRIILTEIRILIIQKFSFEDVN